MMQEDKPKTFFIDADKMTITEREFENHKALLAALKTSSIESYQLADGVIVHVDGNAKLLDEPPNSGFLIKGMTSVLWGDGVVEATRKITPKEIRKMIRW